MTEAPRPPGEGAPGDQPRDPTAPGPTDYGMPGAPGGAPPPAGPTSGSPQYDTPGYGAGPGQPPPYGTPAPGYGYPPSGTGYPPPAGYPTGAHGYPAGGGYPGGPPTPVGYATNDEKTWALLAHFGAILLGFIAPLIAMVAKGNESPTVRAHAVEALNFQLTWTIATVIASIAMACTFGFLFFLPMITIGIAWIFAIVGGVKANEGALYRYPMNIRMVK